MAKNPFNNVDRSLTASSMFPLEGETDQYPGIEIVEDPEQSTPQEQPFPEEDLMGMEESSVEMTEDGGAVVTLGPQPTDIDSIGFGDNLADGMDEGDLGLLSSDLCQLIEDDDTSREEWRSAYEKGLTLLGLTYEDRTEPFAGATGVTHPILNEAVTQFQAQAYKELLPAGGPVRTRVVGMVTPEIQAQADRVKAFMNYQITEVMEEYDPEYDQMLYYTGYGGSTFKKVYYDSYLGRATSAVIFPKDLIVPYNAKDLFTADRVTHVIRISKNDLRRQQLNGFYRDVEIGDPTDYEADDITQKEDKIRGVEPSAISEEYVLYECHCNWEVPGFEIMDEDGEPSGLRLPYIITVEKGSGEVLSIRRNYSEEDPKQRKKQYFVHYKMLPGLGFYGFGLVHLLGNLSRSATSILRQLIDAGTLANLPAGFKAKGLRIQDSGQPLQPGEWRDVDAPGGDLAANLMPLPYKEPSATLYQLLGFCITAAEKFIGTTDLGMGDTNQEMPVGTTIAVLERGGRVMSAVHKRLHYALKQELKLLAQVFADYLPPEYPYEVIGGDKSIKQSDFDGRIDIIPVSDPNIFSMTQRITLAQEQLKLAQSDPASHNMREALRRMYAALGVEDIDGILKPEQPPQPTGPANENAQLINVPNGAPVPQVFEEQNHMAHIQMHIQLVKLPLIQNTPAAMAAITAHVFEHIGFAARQQVMQQQPQQPQQPMQQGQQPQQPPPPDPQMEAQIAELEVQMAQQVLAAFGGGEADPLVELKGRELDIKEQDSQQRANEAAQRIQLDVQKAREKQQMDAERIQSTQDIAKMRVEAQLMKNGLL